MGLLFLSSSMNAASAESQADLELALATTDDDDEGDGSCLPEWPVGEGGRKREGSKQLGKIRKRGITCLA